MSDNSGWLLVAFHTASGIIQMAQVEAENITTSTHLTRALTSQHSAAAGSTADHTQSRWGIRQPNPAPAGCSWDLPPPT